MHHRFIPSSLSDMGYLQVDLSGLGWDYSRNEAANFV
jgi:hypothetical protein